jgi:hypothetical protein
MVDPNKLVAKLKKPPAVQNWVKNIHPRTDETARSLYDTAVFGPRHSLKLVGSIIAQVVIDDISDEQARKCASRIANPRVRKYAYEVLDAILPYIRKKSWKGIQIFKDMTEYYPVGANVDVPIRPTFVVNDDGKVVPYFVICWTVIGLTDYQKRIMSTLISEAIMSLEEFEESDAVIVCVPRHCFSKSERHVVEWNISDFALLTSEEKADLFERYGNALAEAERMIFENLG